MDKMNKVVYVYLVFEKKDYFSAASPPFMTT